MEGKQYHDVIGGYQRLDVFDLRIDRSRRPPVSILTPKRILDEEERLASGSATMFIPENIGASSERYGARITSGLPWLRSQIEETSPGDEDATNKKEPRTGNLPTGYGNMDDAFDRALLFKKKQEAMSHGQPGGGPERTPLKIRRHIPLPVEKQEAISDGPPGGRPERTPLKRRYLFKPDEKD